MKKIIILSAVASIFALSCKKAQPVQKVEGHKGSAIIATVEQHGTDTKTALSGTSVLWCAGDAITVFTDASEKAEYTTTESGASVEFTTTAELTGSPVYALYPYQADASISGSVITFTVPTTQTYAENSFGNGANIAVGTFDGESVELKNACGVLRLNLSIPGGQVAKVGRIELSDPTNNLAGTFTADAASGFTATCTSGTKKITLDCGEGVDLSTTAKTFNIVVPVGSLSGGFTAEVYSKEDHLITTLSTVNNNAPARSKIVNMPEKSLSWLPEGYTEIEYTFIDPTSEGNTAYPLIRTGLKASDFGGFGGKFSAHYAITNSIASFFGLSDSQTSGVVGGKWLRINDGERHRTEYGFGSGYRFFDPAKQPTEGAVFTIELTIYGGNQKMVVSGVGTVQSTLSWSGPVDKEAYFLNMNYGDRALTSNQGRQAGYFGRVYYSRFYTGAAGTSNWKRYYIPCVRETDSTVGFYELVTRTFHVNEGVGDFVSPAYP